MRERLPAPLPPPLPDAPPPRVTFPGLSAVEGLAHGCFTRHGGVSEGPFASLNAGFRTGDDPRAVTENTRRMREALGLRVLVAVPQVHGAVVHTVDAASLASWGRMHGCIEAPEGDALATNLLGVGLLIRAADCQPVLFCDPRRGVAAAAHSGWRGSVANVAGETARAMRERFGCNPRDIRAAVGPSLGPCCAEFVNHRRELPEAFQAFASGPARFDFWAITRAQLEAEGLLPEHIEISGICTVCERHRFFSHRGERSPGRLGAAIGWRESA